MVNFTCQFVWAMMPSCLIVYQSDVAVKVLYRCD